MPLPEGLNQFKARCATAGITEPVDLRIDWVVQNEVLVNSIRDMAIGRKVFIYQPPKLSKNLEMDLLKPKSFSFARFIAGAKSDEYFRIRMGHSQYVETNGHTNYELDLLDRLKVTDALDVCTIGDVFFGEECYLTHIAEALDRQVICMLSRRAALSKEWVRHRTLERMFEKRHLASVVYDEAA
jgi:hypothetical protein